MMETNYIAKTFQGLEGVLEQELIDLGATQTKKLSRAVAFEGDLALLYRANLQLRTALRIFVPLGTEIVKNQKGLYEFASAINWLRWFSPQETFAINARAIKAPNFNNDAFVALKVKDAIVDQFRRLKGSRPSVDKTAPDITIDVHLFKDRCTISIDSSGTSLHQRGYRQSGHRAPLNEVLAAGLVLLSGWDAKKPLIDPFCGTGTILIEAAMLAQGKAPNILRKQFGFETWKNYDKKLWEKIWLEARAQERSFDAPLIGSDISPKVIQHARQHVAKAGVDENIRLSSKHFNDRAVPKEAGVLISNPPYGERLDRTAVEELYKDFGDRLKNAYTGYEAWVISAVDNFHRFVGLRPSEKLRLFNGGLPCQYMKFELYKGSKREDKRVDKILPFKKNTNK